MASIFHSKSKSSMIMSIRSQGELLTKRPNDPRDFAKLFKVISMPHDVPSTFDRRMLELEDQITFNDSLLAMETGKMECEGYHSLPRKSIRKAIMFKRVTRKIGMEGNFVIPCNVGGTKDMSNLVDQGSDVNVMPLSVYNRLTDEKLVKTNVRLALASNSHIYPLGIAKDVLVEVTGFVYPVDFMILDIKEDVKKPLILGTPFFTTARAEIKFDKGTISLRFGKSMVQFHISPEPFPTLNERDENKINTISVVNKRVLEWEEKIKFHHTKELEFEVIFDKEKPGSS
ncbi:reverse transcriptase domain-containing protein [Tanacetum coccineum]